MSVLKFSDIVEQTNKDVQNNVEQKNKYDYLPWAPAWEIMMMIDPNAKVTEKEFEHYQVVSGQHEDFLVKKLLPYQTTNNSSYVSVTVEMNGKEETEIYPVMDYKNQDIADPRMTQVNKSLKRAFVKALAKHGIGLYIYKGEDLPVINTISFKELEKLDSIIEKFIGENDIENKDKLITTVINIANKQISQDFNYLEPIDKLEKMNTDQYGLFMRCFNAVKDKTEKDKKE